MKPPGAETSAFAKIENAPWIAGVLLFCLARLAILEYWLIVRLESFYFYRGDDVGRLIQAVLWSKRMDIRPMSDWLPLPCYLIGLALNFFPYPQSAASHLHAVFTTVTLALIGLTTLRLFPKNPAASVIALLGLQFAPEFQALSLSASAEVEMWLFLAFAVFFWTLYAARGERRYAWLNAVSLGLAAMTRYEAWLFLVLFCVLATDAFRRRKEPRWVLGAYVLILFGYVAFFAAYQEHGLDSFRTHPEMLALVLPLSYRGIRLHFHSPLAAHVNIVRSYRLPFVMFVTQFPAMSLAGLAGAARSVYTKAASSWLALLWAAAMALFCLVSGFFGASLDSSRLIILFYLLISPFFGLACAALLPASARSLPAAALASILCLGFLTRRLPRPSTMASPGSPGTAVIGKAVYLVGRDHHESPGILFELYENGPESYAENYLQFAAFDRVRLDRRKVMPVSTRVLITQDNPSVFQGAQEDLRKYLRENGISLIVAHSRLAAEKLRGLAEPIASIGAVSLYGSGLPQGEVDAYRERIRQVSSAMDRDD